MYEPRMVRLAGGELLIGEGSSPYAAVDTGRWIAAGRPAKNNP